MPFAVVTSNTFLPVCILSYVAKSCKQFEKYVSYNNSKMDHGWPAGKKVTIADCNNSHLCYETENMSAIVGINFYGLDHFGS